MKMELTPEERLRALKHRPEKTGMMLLADVDTGRRTVLYMRRNRDAIYTVGTLELTPAVRAC